jgi:DNA helicase-2/ATP-dependent DNA helicase PcrA
MTEERRMPWHEGLLDEQKNAASHFGCHARLLAGPGTGKTLTLTRRICCLVEDHNVVPSEILVLTFTRAATHELRQRVKKALGTEKMPRISTLHSFSLRQLLLNSEILTSLPQPLRIADDWEERNIILEDLKALLSLAKIDQAKDLFAQLSADWQTLTADDAQWDQRFPNPRFLGAWKEHRQLFGYTLRSELVYQLRKGLEQHGDFSVEGPPKYLLVDEYQDLNRCDLAVIHAIRDKGAELFVAGDDDQSIYGFRKAHPNGIRRFIEDNAGAKELALSLCKRCDPEILKLGLFVAEQDFRREPKQLTSENGRQGGQVAILRFGNENEEAAGVATLCHYLVCQKSYNPHDILILFRSDNHSGFSDVVRQQILQKGLSVTESGGESGPLTEGKGRYFLSLLRLLANRRDHLAWRTVLEVNANGVGKTALDALYKYATTQGITFAEALFNIASDPTLIARGSRVKAVIEESMALLAELEALVGDKEQVQEESEIFRKVASVVSRVITDSALADNILKEIQKVATETGDASFSNLMDAVESNTADIEPDIEEGKINILTMHKAKGLTFKATIIMAAENEYIPGRAQGDAVGDERRLLYVSLTRAMHHLYVTYCDKRIGQQRHTGTGRG